MRKKFSFQYLANPHHNSKKLVSELVEAVNAHFQVHQKNWSQKHETQFSDMLFFDNFNCTGS